MAEQIPDLPSNSLKKKPDEERPKLEKVVSGEVSERKKPLGRRLGESFAGDDAQTVGQFVLFDVIVPAIKTMVVDMVQEGIQRLVMGDSARSRPSNGRTQYVQYSQLSNKSSSSPYSGPKPSTVRAADEFGLDDILLASRGDAEVVRDRMWEQLREYGAVSVADLKDLVGKSSEFTDHKYGWVDLRGVEPRRAGRDGYILNLPRPAQL